MPFYAARMCGGDFRNAVEWVRDFNAAWTGVCEESVLGVLPFKV